MKDKYDDHLLYGKWDLSRDVDVSGWKIQDQTWYRCVRGWFLVSVSKDEGLDGQKAQWFCIGQYHGLDRPGRPDWFAWDGELPVDIINFDMADEFDLNDIELAERIMEGCDGCG